MRQKQRADPLMQRARERMIEELQRAGWQSADGTIWMEPKGEPELLLNDTCLVLAGSHEGAVVQIIGLPTAKRTTYKVEQRIGDYVSTYELERSELGYLEPGREVSRPAPRTTTPVPAKTVAVQRPRLEVAPDQDGHQQSQTVSITAFTRTISTRDKTFTCAQCGQTVTEQRYPGHMPLYCSACVDEVRKQQTRDRVNRLRERRRKVNQQKETQMLYHVTNRRETEDSVRFDWLTDKSYLPEKTLSLHSYWEIEIVPLADGVASGGENGEGVWGRIKPKRGKHRPCALKPLPLPSPANLEITQATIPVGIHPTSLPCLHDTDSNANPRKELQSR